MHHASLSAPVIKPVHSWSMMSVKDSRIPGDHPPPVDKLSDSSIIFHARHPHSQEIPGNPDLTSHGEMTLIDGGLAFDAQDTHAVAQIAPDDCVINTEKCSDGLSFGTKLKFEKLEEETTPRYIVDTGAHDKGMRGFSLYTKQDKLVTVLRTADREWKVLRMDMKERLFFNWLFHKCFCQCDAIMGLG